MTDWREAYVAMISTGTHDSFYLTTTKLSLTNMLHVYTFALFLLGLLLLLSPLRWRKVFFISCLFPSFYCVIHKHTFMLEVNLSRGCLYGDGGLYDYKSMYVWDLPPTLDFGCAVWGDNADCSSAKGCCSA